MPQPFWSGSESRSIIERIVIEGDLVLQTPAHFGNGDTDDLTDMPLLVDPFDGKTPLLTGASIVGAMRSYIREWEYGYGQAADGASASVRLFGSLKEDDEGEQSSLIVDDALGKNFAIEIRHGVRIHPSSRTAEEDKLFNLQLWQAGTTFTLRFELLVREFDNAQTLKGALATALAGLTQGSITLGGRKRRGYGRVSVQGWRVKSYDQTKSGDLLDWIQHGDEPLPLSYTVSDPTTALGNPEASLVDKRQLFTIEATFTLDGSLLIRSGNGQDDQGPDMVHLHARQANGVKEPILSGTSLGGVLRARARKIINTLGSQQTKALIDQMFGPDMTGEVRPRASRVSVCETVVHNARTDLVQNRVSIDRFTGGARDTALFNEQPAFGDDDTSVTVEVRLITPEDHEIGLLLLLLKDLWTEDLPLGGESGIGRGRLKGKQAVLTYQHHDTCKQWIIATTEKGLQIGGDGGRDALETYVTALNTYVRGG